MIALVNGSVCRIIECDNPLGCERYRRQSNKVAFVLALWLYKSTQTLTQQCCYSLLEVVDVYNSSKYAR